MKKKNQLFLFILLGLALLPAFFDGGNQDIVKYLSLLFISLTSLFILMDSKTKPSKNTLIYLLVFLFSLALSTIFSLSPWDSLNTLIEYFGLSLLLIGLASLDLDKEQKILAIKTITVIAATVSLIGLYFFATGTYHRLTATFYWPNPVATYLLISLPLAGYWLINSKKPLIPGLLNLIIISALILTFSRGAGLVLLVLILIALIIKRKSLSIKNTKWLILCLVLALALSGLFIYGKTQVNDAVSQDIHSTSSTDRLIYYQTAWQIWQQHPVLGSGWNNFGNLYPSLQTQVAVFSQYAHSWPLEILSEGGLINLLASLLLIIYLLFSSRSAPAEKNVNLVIKLAILGIILHSCIDVSQHFWANQLMLWLLLGLLANFKMTNSKPAYKLSGSIIVIIIIALNSMALLGQIYALQAQRSLNSQNLVKAINQQDKAQKLSWNSQVDYKLAVLNNYAGDINSAQKNIDKAIAKNPINHNYFTLAGILAVKNNNLKLANDYLSQAHNLAPLSLKTNLNLMLLLASQERWQEIIDLGQTILSYPSADFIQAGQFLILPGQDNNNPAQTDLNSLQKLTEQAQQQLEKSQ